MHRYIAGACVTVLISTVLLCHGQTAVSTNKPGNAVTSAVIGNSNNVVRRVHTKIRKAAEPEFLALANSKKTTTDDIRTIMRLIREKQAGLDKINRELTTGFSIISDRNYSYDVKTKTIHEILGVSSDANAAGGAKATSAGSTSPAGNKRVHMVLDSKVKADKFIELTTAKQLMSTVVRVLALLQQEKESELARINSDFLQKFGMSKDRGYEYDPKIGALYELIPMPGTGKDAGR